MKYLICAAALVVGPAIIALPPMLSAAENTPWAYPVAPKGAPKRDPAKIVTQPGSEKKYNEVEINNPYGPPDWYPGDHPPMPPVVANGVKPAVRACAMCHLTSGDGHPESSGLAGLPAAYIIRQMADFKNGNRKGVRSGNMITFAQAISEDDTRAAAAYFAALKPSAWTKVVETDTVPQTFIGPGAMRFAVPGGGSEPIGNRIINVPQDAARAASRDARSGFIDYVPTGSIKRGEALVTTGGDGKTVPCGICHGPTLKGLAEIPPLAGRTGIYLVRQLNDMQVGSRSGVGTELMKAVVAKLSADDMVAIAAYLTSREP
jgi:cytochrome c553